MTTIVTRAGKGSPLTHTEVDTNFTNLNTNKLETAAIPLGTAAAPSISFLSDADSGLFSPGANQVAVATNGTGRLFINSAGNIGIGTASPSAWSYGSNITIPGAGRYIASTSDDIRFASNVYSSDVDRYVSNGFATRYRMADGTHQWATAVTGTAGNAITYNESMRITAGGLVGIGIGSPSATLHVPGSSILDGAQQIQNQINSGTSVIRNTGITAVSSPVAWNNGSIFEIVCGVCPNVGGSASYRSAEYGIIVISTGYNGNVVTFIDYVSLATGGSKGAGVVTVSAVFWDGTTETAYTSNSNAQIRIKLTGAGDPQSSYFNITKRGGN